MPVRCTIHSSEVSTSFSNQAFGTIRSGTYEPVPAIPTAIRDAMRSRGGAPARAGARGWKPTGPVGFRNGGEVNPPPPRACNSTRGTLAPRKTCESRTRTRTSSSSPSARRRSRHGSRRAARRGEAALDVLGDARVRGAHGLADRVRDRALVRASVADDHDAVHAEQERAAVALV